MKPEAPPSPSTPTTPRAPSLQPTAPPEPTRAPRRGNRGKAAKYGPLDRAAESWTDRELTECLRRFIDLIISALGSGRAYLADAKGKPPEGRAAACGWTWYQSGIDRGCWQIDNRNSVRIGWLDDGRVYLDANEAARLTQAFAAQQNKPLSNPDTVVARLAEKGWLAVERTGGKRGTRRGRPWRVSAGPTSWPSTPWSSGCRTARGETSDPADTHGTCLRRVQGCGIGESVNLDNLGLELTVHESRVTSVQKRMEPRRSLLGASVDHTEAQDPLGHPAARGPQGLRHRHWLAEAAVPERSATVASH